MWQIANCADCLTIDDPNPTDYHSVPAGLPPRGQPGLSDWFARFAEQTSFDFQTLISKEECRRFFPFKETI
jgi:hypothetical protein